MKNSLSFFNLLKIKIMKELFTTDANAHAENIKAELETLTSHLRKDIERVTDGKAKALFETSAEVLTGLAKAFDDFIKKEEAAWKEE
jgi:hypothetical protein